MFKKSIIVISCLCTWNLSQAQKDIENSVRKIETLLRYIDRYYVDTVNIDAITEKIINSTLEDLDPHSVYIPKSEVQQANEPLTGNFDGIGVQFNILNDTISVVATIIGGPSEKLGILAGDKIIKVDGENVAGVAIKNEGVMKRLRGKKGTKVTVSIQRRGQKKLIDYTIVRDKIPIFSVDASYMIDAQTGYIKLSRFANTTMKEIREKLDTLRQNGMKHLVLDLTGNSGGYLHIANQLADEFLSDRKMIVYTEGTHFPKTENFATKYGSFEKGNLIIMIDAGSASASEIVSGAVQDWDRGLIVGRRSFGKGLVQKPYEFPDTSVVRLTIQRYYTPVGRSIQKPYQDYKNDFMHRFEHGELFSQDSIKLPDSLKYETKNGRTVYGGGGIMPDVFVPLDTSMNSMYYTDLLRKGVFNTFSLNYLDDHRKELTAKYKTMVDFKSNFMITDAFYNEFLENAKKQGVERNEAGIKTSEKLIKTLLKAYICRGMFNTDGFFYIANDLNPIYLKSVEILNNGTYKSYKLVDQ